jgi:hypothetical protein
MVEQTSDPQTILRSALPVGVIASKYYGITEYVED